MGSTEEYEAECYLGEGTFGAVVKARHRATGRSVAIKSLLAAPLGGHAALLREARFLEACAGNPFVVGCHGLVRDPATLRLGLVMECVGPSLRDLLRHRGSSSDYPPPLPEATVRAAMWQLLEGARRMHSRHVIHRDIKPANVLVDGGRGVVKICDFGLAVSAAAAAAERPPPYDPAGTLWYMAPEVLLEKPDYDARVHTWSLGCVMAELLSGRVLFHALNEEGQLCAIFDVLGAPDDGTWPWFASTTFATGLLPEMDMPRHSTLRELFPETELSEEGFQVLRGLLTCNPDQRLTAAAALKHPWFAKMDGPLELPKKEASTTTLPKRPRLQQSKPQ